MIQEPEKRSVEVEQSDLRFKLARLIGHAMPDAKEIEVSVPVRTSTGLSRENWVFNAGWRDGSAWHSLPLILRRDPPGSLLETDRLHELKVLEALAQTDLPVPAVRWSDVGGAWLGSPSLIMDIVEGDCDWYVLNGDRSLSERLGIAHDLLDMLIRIQQVDWRSLKLDEIFGLAGGCPAVHELDRWNRERIRVQREAIPELDLVYHWLRHRARPARKLVLVHGDYKPGNVLLDGARISALLDWETAHIGDPLEDLGWVTNPVRSDEHQISGHWQRDEISAHYKAATNYEFDDEELSWWNIFSCWKLSIIILTGLAAGIDGRFDRIYHNPSWLCRRMFAMMGV